MNTDRQQQLEALFPKTFALTSVRDDIDRIYTVHSVDPMYVHLAPIDECCVPFTVGTRALLRCMEEGVARPCTFIADAPRGKHRGVDLFWNSEGYFGTGGICNHYGYCDTIEELRAEIDADMDDRSPETPLDTPSLDTSFHDHEMRA